MKVIFNCKHYDFHKDYCLNIHNELIQRGYTSIISTTEEYYPDADFTIQPDEACKNQGGLGIWINHAFPFIPHNKFYLEENFIKDLTNHSDYIFTFSKAWDEWHSHYNLPIEVVGMPKLDNLFNAEKKSTTILYAPTWNKDLTSLDKVNIKKLEQYGNVIFRGHPAFHNNEYSLDEALKLATIVISDYSSVGLESIVVNIPTIMFESNIWKGKRYDHISNDAMEAAICVDNQKDLETSVQYYINNPTYLEDKRLKHSNILCEYQGDSSKQFVNTLEKIKNNGKS
jgi:hypothetical protein